MIEAFIADFGPLLFAPTTLFRREIDWLFLSVEDALSQALRVNHQ
jgi:hypothetical protein